ncbi:hypothetical protein [Terrabacter sp. MAHUQ-38]|uniref:hypothetical protein n=1 Tax=unclassified Terrabacter TaxID=2630222 RepID=UPI00165E28CE|nr:hypothetical protein [Terrabacter sp. MAHUQ-38]MBC9820516.1 hypothetical protein [Terrabacter sp. MAHUQ-38]
MNVRPFKVYLPAAADIGNILGTISTMLRAVGWDLGYKYDAFMQPIAGPNWLEALRQKRVQGYNPPPMYKQKLNLRDPAFCLREPAKNSDSPLREVLPKTPMFYDLMETVANIRNAEFHFESLPTLEKLEQYAKQVTQLALQADLPLKNEMGAVLTRIAQLKAGDVPPPPKVAHLVLQVQRSQQQLKIAAAQLAEARGLAKANAAAQVRLQSLEAEFEAMHDELQLAQIAVQAASHQARETAVGVDLGRLRPGDPWPTPPEGRPLRLLPRVADLYDPDAVDLLSNEVGPVAFAAARRWTSLLPHGGTVILNESGAGVALIGATWTYLGSLDSTG